MSWPDINFPASTCGWPSARCAWASAAPLQVPAAVPCCSWGGARSASSGTPSTPGDAPSPFHWSLVSRSFQEGLKKIIPPPFLCLLVEGFAYLSFWAQCKLDGVFCSSGKSWTENVHATKMRGFFSGWSGILRYASATVRRTSYSLGHNVFWTIEEVSKCIFCSDTSSVARGHHQRSDNAEVGSRPLLYLPRRGHDPLPAPICLASFVVRYLKSKCLFARRMLPKLFLMFHITASTACSSRCPHGTSAAESTPRRAGAARRWGNTRDKGKVNIEKIADGIIRSILLTSMTLFVRHYLSLGIGDSSPPNYANATKFPHLKVFSGGEKSSFFTVENWRCILIAHVMISAIRQCIV